MSMIDVRLASVSNPAMRRAGVLTVSRAFAAIEHKRNVNNPTDSVEQEAPNMGNLENETEIGLFEMSFRMANTNKQFLFISFLRV